MQQLPPAGVRCSRTVIRDRQQKMKKLPAEEEEASRIINDALKSAVATRQQGHIVQAEAR